MPKFILIDNSIYDTVGHYYQYAVFCLKAAKNLGYEPILATNKKNKDTKNTEWQIHPQYSGTFGSHLEYHSFMISLYQKFEKSKAKVLLYGLFRILGPEITKKLLGKKKIEEFAKNTQDLFSKISISEGDIVFLPTSELVEMFGIAECAKKSPSLNKASWHFLFRRSLYVGSPENYSFAYLKQFLLKLGFDNFFKSVNLRTFFYTDSAQLTDQYDKMGSVKFHTLPIPHTVPKQASKKQDDKLVVTYLGDARTEKGYQYLPSLVQDLWLDYVKNDKILFVIQSNYNVQEGEPAAVVARTQLQTFPSEKVKLVLDSPGHDKYQELLQNTDVMLLPYDKSNYYAKSSGILAESLALGIPVLVPSGTWLSRQFASEVYRYQLSLKERLEVLKSEVADIIYETGKSSGHKLTLSRKTNQSFCLLEIPKTCTFILVTVHFGNENSSSALVLRYTQQNNAKLTISDTESFIEKVELPYATALIPVTERAEEARLEFKQPYTESVLSIDKIDIDYLYSKTTSLPWSSVGIAYDSTERLSHYLKNILDNYGHYLNTAKKFSDTFYKKNNAKELVKILVDMSKSQGGRQTP